MVFEMVQGSRYLISTTKGNEMKIKNIILVIFSAFLANALFGQVIIDGTITEALFDTTLSNDSIWSVQFRAGGLGQGYPDNEFSLSSDGISYFGNTTILNDTSNPFVISVSDTNFLSVTFNGDGTPSGSQPGISEKFNTIWVGLEMTVGNGAANEVSVDPQFIDSTSLPDLYLGSDGWTGYKFNIDGVDNIGEVDISGNIIPNMFYGVANNDDWTYTVFATYTPIDPIPPVPEPSECAFLAILSIISIAYLRKKRGK